MPKLLPRPPKNLTKVKKMLKNAMVTTNAKKATSHPTRTKMSKKRRQSTKTKKLPKKNQSKLTLAMLETLMM